MGDHIAPSIEETPDSVRIVMPVERVGCVAVFLGVWLVGWAVGELTAISALLRSDTLLDAGVAFLLVWLAAWTVGGVAAAAILAMVLGGREVVTVTPEGIDRRAEAFGRGLNWKYAMADITNVRPTGDSGDSDNSKDFISFDHCGKTVRFGTSLSGNEAQLVAEAVWARFPQLMSRVQRVRREEAARTATPRA